MPTVEFAPALTRHVACPPQRVEAATLRDALSAAFEAAPAMRNYVLDEQGCVRKHVAVFVNAAMIADRARLDIALAEDDKVMVIQALTGG
ncbi:MoaD/ThiS family protein [Caenimonas aquaedulcis]|uniref:MoaD/ThiS family protein n=1 Tax=Caenimonas aquaedulcis TaxID=2793270 RepID=A0A931H253_9BURK|nr:MoaD/ThiS family protein [Caenimonas aquaedulcis]MBG9387162.1 MoaD/ThiS family protein [Caenimonas aquaedulcis]